LLIIATMLNNRFLELFHPTKLYKIFYPFTNIFPKPVIPGCLRLH
jgi:hypothetical protein